MWTNHDWQDLYPYTLGEEPDSPDIMNINCWNEWTEGSYLEPDMVHGTAYLDVVKEVMGE